MSKMNAIVFRSTGHVLGAVTRSTQPDTALAVNDVAAQGVIVRDDVKGSLKVNVAMEQLSVALIDYDTRLIYYPHKFALQEGTKPEELSVAIGGVKVELNGTLVTVTLMTQVADDTHVFVYVTGGGLTESVVSDVLVPKTTNQGTAHMALSAPSYDVVAFAPGYATTVATISVV